MTPSHRVAVTGLGVVSAAGLNMKENLESLSSGLSALSPEPDHVCTRLRVPVGEVRCSNAALLELLGPGAARAAASIGVPDPSKVTRTALLAALAVSEAVSDAALSIPGSGLRVGLIVGTSVGGMDMSERFYEKYSSEDTGSKGDCGTEPDWEMLRTHDCGSVTDFVAAYISHGGFRTTISTACSSAGNAIMLGARMIRAGLLDVAIAGGSDALSRFTINGFNSLRILSSSPCRPFDAARDGLNLGEGAGFLVLSAESCMRRDPYCMVTGWANVNEAFHQTGSSPDGEGAFMAMSSAISMAGLSPSDIDYINVHGTATPGNDLSEGRAISRLFGAACPPFSSLKGYIGHTLAASEGIEAALCASLFHFPKGRLWPSLGFSSMDETIGLTPLAEPVEKCVNHVVSNCFGFGGNGCSLVFSKVSDSFVRPLPVEVVKVGACRYDANNQPDYKVTVPDANLRRRMSPMVRMGVSSILSCIGERADEVDAVITVTSLGCLADTEKFLREIESRREEMLNPAAFIYSTFNTVGAQAALMKGLKCYNMTYVDGIHGVRAALEDARLCLAEGCRTVVVAAFDECTELSAKAFSALGLKSVHKMKACAVLLSAKDS